MASSLPDRFAFNARVRQVRREVYGEEGIPLLAGELGIPPRTWENLEAGVTIPGPVLLKFLALTGVSPDWLLEGEGEPYAGRSADQNALS